MTEEKAKKISELYAELSKLSDSYSRLLDSAIIMRTINLYRECEGIWADYNIQLNNNIKSKLKTYLISLIEEEMTRVKSELTVINCE